MRAGGGKAWALSLRTCGDVLGLAFGDELLVLEAAGAKAVKEVGDVKAGALGWDPKGLSERASLRGLSWQVVSVMLMAPAGVDGSEEVSRCEAQVVEARAVVARLAGLSGDEVTKERLLLRDLLARASTQLDCLELVGAQRERRRELLKQIEVLEQDLEAMS